MRNNLVGHNRTTNPFRFFEQLENELETMWSRPQVSGSFSPAVDVEENENGFHLSFDVPGVNQDDLNLEFHEGVLKVSGERKKEIESERYSEKSYGRFERTFSLPDSADVENIQASHNNGVLTVLIPKKQAVKPRKIEVKIGQDPLGSITSSTDEKKEKH